MRKNIQAILSLWIGVLLLLTGCQQAKPPIAENQQKIYFFDQTRNELVTEPIGEEFRHLSTNQEKVAYIIDRLISNKSTQMVSLQNNTPIPYLRISMSDNLEKDPTVKFHFTSAYNELTPVEKIGIRVSIVYSLAELDFISGVDFYVEDKPLITATGNAVGTISTASIKMDVLDPNPATTPYSLALYFLDEEGLLERVVRGGEVSGSASVEKILIEELIKGPDVEGLFPTMPSDVKINEVKVANGTCYVDLSFDIKSKFFSSEAQKEYMIYSIVDSLTEMQQIKKVVIYLDGQSGIAFTQQIDFGDILERSEEYISQK